jgi:hypothetical protein
MSEEQPSISPRLVTGLIMLSLLLWGAYVAVGAYLYNMNPWRGLIVLAAVGLFLGLWMLALWSRGRRVGR